MTRPEHSVADAAVALGRGLRAAGLAGSVDQELVFCRALAELDLRSRSHVYWAARAAFVRSRDEAPAFDAVFTRFWAGLSLEPGESMVQHGETDPRMSGPQHGGPSLPQFRQAGLDVSLVDGQSERATREVPSAGTEDKDGSGRDRRRGLLAAYSPDELTAPDERLDYGRDELAAVRRLAEELRAALPERRSRRRRPSRHSGQLDVRRTLRRSLETDGELLRPAWAAPSRARRRLLLFCDVSGSMERYSRGLLAGLQAVVRSGATAETFVFATHLTRLTRDLAGRDAARALDEARAAVVDWSGGTRIGHALADFNDRYARRGLARGAVVIVVSDGWDRGDPDRLAHELERLRLQARRLVWLNPRPGAVGRQPLAVGLRAALPHVDDYVAGCDTEAVAELVRLIGGVGSERPARRQRAVRLTR